MLAFLSGALFGFGVGAVVFWAVDLVLRLASAVFPGLEWLLPFVPDDAWISWAKVGAVCAGIFTAAHPESV